jgi:serine/threonine-protein kinase
MSNRVLAGRYELIDMIGNGGMAVVYKAKDRLLNRFVAIKILKPNYSKDAKFIENFRRESRAAASLSHPNIVAIYDVGWEGNINYIVMELVDGKTLADLIAERGRLNPRDAVKYAKQIASALSHAHEHGIIHRDVKPHNVLITSDNVAKLTDFGIAKAAETGTMVGNTGTVLGSVHYLSPEQARGGYVDEKTDIYSLGIVMYEMLTGKVPFDAENPVSVALMHVNNDIVPPTELVPEIPESIENVVMKATQKYPVQRYKSAKELFDALGDAMLDTIGVDTTTIGVKDTDLESYSHGKETDPAVRGTGEEKLTDTGTTTVDVVTERRPRTRDDSGDDAPRQGHKGKAPFFAFGKKRRNTGDEDGGDDPDAKKGHDWIGTLVKLVAVALAVALSVPLSRAVAARINDKPDDTPTEVTVPSLAGKTYEEAAQALEALGLNIARGTEVASYDYEEGRIVSQTPKAENVVKTGATVTVNISKGYSTGTVPNVVGYTHEGAAFRLQESGYIVGSVSHDYSTTIPAGNVISQSPAAGETRAAGSSVNLVISDGKLDTTVPVPDVVTMTLEDAKKALTKAGLTTDEIEYISSAVIAEGIVVAQSVESTERAEQGTAIDLTVSIGPDESGGGETVNFVVDLSDAEKGSFELSIKIIEQANGSSIAYDLPPESVRKSDRTYAVELTGTGTATAVVFYDGVRVKEATINYATKVVTWK